ncbi:protein phosphatase 2c [Striga asiatica]|uniref:protein-serine/threonine phosphatase n=1 Tax=Striga asiatica TaxID=4170 RepID=A0A5A7QS02_STRAF|nr:protein phosphatase 2c [Striga asiatica]
MSVDGPSKDVPAAPVEGVCRRMRGGFPDLRPRGTNSVGRNSKSRRRRRLELRKMNSLSAVRSGAVGPRRRISELEFGGKSAGEGIIDAGSGHGTASLVGRRREMEDAVAAEPGFLRVLGRSYDFYGVYDGHGGRRVRRRWWWRTAATRGRCFAARGRLCSCRRITSMKNSRIWQPDRVDELERIEACGGKVINWDVARVIGVLATSRSIGDYYLKPYVIPNPEVRVIDRTVSDEFLILASDGLWDVVSNELACQVARKCLAGRLRKGVNRFEEAAGVLAELAISRGSGDNVSVVVVGLR